MREAVLVVEAQWDERRDPAFEHRPERVPGVLHRPVLVRVSRPQVRSDSLDVALEPVPLTAEVLIKPNSILRLQKSADRVVHDRWGQTRWMLLEDREPPVEIREKVGRGVAHDDAPRARLD